MLVTEQLYKENGKYFILRRRFLGKLDNFNNRTEQAFEKRNLKAYLKGEDKFKFGFKTTEDNKRIPQWFDTAVGVQRIEITKEEANKLLKKNKKSTVEELVAA